MDGRKNRGLFTPRHSVGLIGDVISTLPRQTIGLCDTARELTGENRSPVLCLLCLRIAGKTVVSLVGAVGAESFTSLMGDILGNFISPFSEVFL